MGSESERILQGAHSVYGVDAQNEMQQACSKLRQDLYMLSESSGSQSWAPSPVGRQLQFTVECTDDEFSAIRMSITAAFDDFHRRVCNAKGVSPAAGSSKTQEQLAAAASETSGADNSAAEEQQKQQWNDADSSAQQHGGDQGNQSADNWQQQSQWNQSAQSSSSGAQQNQWNQSAQSSSS